MTASSDIEAQGSRAAASRRERDDPPPPRRGAVIAWCLYDWANSAFPAVITTFVFATYFSQMVAPDPVRGMADWGLALSIAGAAVAVLSPPLGAIADRTGGQKRWLGVFTLLTVALVGALWFVTPSPRGVMPALIGIALSTVAFEIECIFYNALLPSVAPQTHLGRVSGWGWGAGYLGGIACLGAILILFIDRDPPWLGLDVSSAEHVRIAAPFSAFWHALFAIPLFVLVRESPCPPIRMRIALRAGLHDLRDTIAGARAHRDLAWFMLAHMIYADGLTTLFAFGGIYAAGTFGMAMSEVVVFGIALNLTAGLGALAFAWVDDWIGARRTIAIGLLALMCTGAGLLVVESKSWFWILGLVMGVFFGPVQSASRSLVARLASPQQRTQMFGIFALSGRVTAFAGPAVLAAVASLAESQRAGMASILVFFAVGLLLILTKVGDPPPPLRTFPA